MSPRTRVVGAGLVLAATAVLVARGQAPDGAQSSFRTRTDLIPVDVSVLDENRKPVRGLTAADFQVYEDGRQRAIVAFSAVEIPTTSGVRTIREAGGAASWVRDVPPDLVRNDLPQEGRLVVILFDRSIPAGRPVAEAQAIARAAVDALGPDDMAGIARSSGFSDDGRVQGFTTDRRLLRQAVDAPFKGWTPAPKPLFQAPSPVPGDDEDMTDCQCGLCVLETIGHVADALSDAPRRKKVILFVGSTLAISPRSLDDECYASFEDARRHALEQIDLANVTFHILDPAGLITTSMTAEYVVHEGDTPQTRMAEQRHYDTANLARTDQLRVLPERTGGRLVTNTNGADAFVPAIFEESQLYYILGFEPSAPADGRVHRIDVRVDRDDVMLHTRRGYTAEDPSAAAGGDADAEAPRPDLVAALHGALPRVEVPMSASIAAFPGRVGEPAQVAVELGASLPPGAGRRQVALTVGAFDLQGQAVQVHEQTVDVPAPVDGSTDIREGLLTRLTLAPGRYEIRAALKDATSGAIGSVFAFADVPDFGDGPLSLSGIVFRGANPPWMPENPLADVLPFVPTVARAFTHAERALAYLRVHQRARPVPVTMQAQVLDTGNAVRFEAGEDLAADDFAAGDAEYGVDLPLASLPPGAYLLRIVGTAGDRHVTRDVRFEVEGS